MSWLQTPVDSNRMRTPNAGSCYTKHPQLYKHHQASAIIQRPLRAVPIRRRSPQVRSLVAGLPVAIPMKRH